MDAMTEVERSAFGKRAARGRWYKVQYPQTYDVIRHMREAIQSTGRIHLLFVDGERAWHLERDHPDHVKTIRAWEAEGLLVGAYGKEATTADILNDVLAG